VSKVANIPEFSSPRRVDDEAMDKAIVRTFQAENKRRRTIEDDYRQDTLSHVHTGDFHYAHIPIAEIWQKTYLDNFGEFITDNDWVCPRCGTRYATGYPPLECNICHTLSPIGEMVKYGVYRR